MNNVEKYAKNINTLSSSFESTRKVERLMFESKNEPKILLHLDPELTITFDPIQVTMRQL